jgi:hypothetical protein
MNVLEGLGMATFVAGHKFNSLRPGEQCIGEDCKGVSSLVSLTSLADVLQMNDDGIAHSGLLNEREIGEIKGARDQIRQQMEEILRT